MPSLADKLAPLIGEIKDIMPAHAWTQREVTKLLDKIVAAAEAHADHAVDVVLANVPVVKPPIIVKKIVEDYKMAVRYDVQINLAGGPSFAVGHTVGIQDIHMHGPGFMKHVAERMGAMLGHKISDQIAFQIEKIEAEEKWHKGSQFSPGSQLSASDYNYLKNLVPLKIPIDLGYADYTTFHEFGSAAVGGPPNTFAGLSKSAINAIDGGGPEYIIKKPKKPLPK